MSAFVRTRRYAGPRDLRAMQELVARIGPERCHLQPGDLAWQPHAFAVTASWPTALWETPDGELVAWAWLGGAALELGAKEGKPAFSQAEK